MVLISSVDISGWLQGLSSSSTSRYRSIPSSRFTLALHFRHLLFSVHDGFECMVAYRFGVWCCPWYRQFWVMRHGVWRRIWAHVAWFVWMEGGQWRGVAVGPYIFVLDYCLVHIHEPFSTSMPDSKSNAKVPSFEIFDASYCYVTFSLSLRLTLASSLSYPHSLLLTPFSSHSLPLFSALYALSLPHSLFHTISSVLSLFTSSPSLSLPDFPFLTVSSLKYGTRRLRHNETEQINSLKSPSGSRSLSGIECSISDFESSSEHIYVGRWESRAPIAVWIVLNRGVKWDPVKRCKMKIHARVSRDPYSFSSVVLHSLNIKLQSGKAKEAYIQQ